MTKSGAIIFLISLLYAGAAAALTTIGTKQFLLQMHKPFEIHLTKRQLTPIEQHNRINVLLEKQSQIKSGSFVEAKPMDLLEMRKKNGTGKIPLKNNFQTMYTGVVALGSQKTKFDVIIDTGSSSFMIDSTLCEQDSCKLAKAYNPEDSETYTKIEPEMGIEIEYGSGTVVGLLSKDDLYMGGVKGKQITFFQIIQEEKIFQSPIFSGILGFGFPSKFEAGVLSPVLDTLLDQGAIKEPVFAFEMVRDQEGSVLTLGYYNKEHFQDVQWHDVQGEGYWMINLDKVYFGEEDTGACDGDCLVVIDSGTSVLSAPTEPLNKMSSFTENYDCTQISEMPDLVFEVDGEKYALSSNEYIATVSEDGELEMYEHSEGSAECAGVFIPMDLVAGDKKIFILGDTFMSKFNIAFDYGNKKIGIAGRSQ